jgi:Transposase Tn5 dimerisation domain
LAQEPTVLAVSDTTSFNYSQLVETQGLGGISSRRHPHLRGLWLHSTLSFTPLGLPLSLVAAQFWSRPQRSGKRQASKVPFEQKESVRWRQSWGACRGVLCQLPKPNLWVNITDMEGDIYEVLAAARDQPSPRVEQLVRSCYNRKLVGQQKSLWEHLAQQPSVGTFQVRVPRRKQCPARLAVLEISFCEVCLEAPKQQRRRGPLHLWAVQARELNPPDSTEAILWRLVSTLPVTTAQAAIEKVHWYTVRWGIEVFHKIIKSVCRAEHSQLKTAQRLERVLMIDLIVAWRIDVLTQVGRQNPGIPASDVFAECEWKALYSYIHHSRCVPAQAPGLGQMMLWIGRLGGFVKATKANPHPGTITLARGLGRLSDLAEMWAIQNPTHAQFK